MQEPFYKLAEHLTLRISGEEVLLLNFAGEAGDFVRFNNSRLRQAGSVTQSHLDVELIAGNRHASRTITLLGDEAVDFARAEQTLSELREQLPHTPEDPYLLYATEVNNSEQIGENRLGPAEDAIDAVLAAGEGRDLVGIFAQGGIYRGFANSLGQRNWFASHSLHLDFCFYAHHDKAVKTSYAGFAWDDAEFARKVELAGEQLEVLRQPARTIDPGEYRVYLAPAALEEYLHMMSFNAFGLKARRTRNTCLLKMAQSGATLNPAVTIRQNTRDGLAANFTDSGFPKPDDVTLVDAGKLGQPLVSARSAGEYDETVNAGREVPDSLDVAPGEIPTADVPQRLGEGIYANTLWYLNFSDLPACRITGMTRFATFWVEGGRIAAPLNVMRFDETAYRILGENLIGLTEERDFRPSSSTYGRRSTDSTRLPGALIENFRFTL